MVELGIAGVAEATWIAQGGFAAVYKARQPAFGRTVAVKILNVGALDEKARQRFVDECRTIGALSDHPHVVALYDSGITEDGHPYLILDYLPHGTLADRLAERGARPSPEVATVGVKLAGALASAHAAGILHRDVKPENVLLSYFDEPHLSDFGLARARGAALSVSERVTCTPAHAAPEVLAGDPATEASDVYSLASTLYTLAAGHAPYVRPSDGTIRHMWLRQARDDRVDLRSQDMPEELWGVLDAALAREPARRTPTALAFGQALRSAQHAAGLPITPLLASPVPLAGRTPAARIVAGEGEGREAINPVPTGAPAGASRPRLGVEPPAVVPPPSPDPPGPARRVNRPARIPDVTARLAGLGATSPPVVASPGPPIVRARTRTTPWWAWMAGGLAIVALVVASVVVLSNVGDGEGASPAATTAPLSSTTATAPSTTAQLTGTTVISAPDGDPGLLAAAPTPAVTAPPHATPTGVPPCAAASFRATATADQSTYRPGEVMQASVVFENTSGQACALTATSAAFHVLNPTGQAVFQHPAVNAPYPTGSFEPGHTQAFDVRWEVVVCSTDPACRQGRHTVVVDVSPYGRGQTTFEVLAA